MCRLLEIRAAISIAFICYAWLAQCEATESEELTDDQLWDAYYEFIQDVKPYRIPIDRRKHETELEPWMTRFRRFDKSAMVESYVEVTSESIRVGLDALTGEVRSFCLNDYDPDLSDRRRKKIKPKLTEDEVAKIALRYLRLNKAMELDEYELSINYKTDHWYILFWRKLDEFRFAKDSICLRYSEKYGLVYYWNRLFSDECDVNLKVSKKEAVRLAEKYLRTVNKNAWLADPKEIGCDAFIVNPALLARRDAPLTELRKTRLAWFFKYVDDTYVDRREPDPMALRFMSLYIDAITGELLHSQRF